MAGKYNALDELDLSLKLTHKEEATRLAAAQNRLLQLRLILGGLIGEEHRIGPPVCVVFEGWDAAGKGGAIKRLVAPLDPRHVRVSSFSAPTYDEKRHHFLWRFWPALPGWGGMAVFDRSWYGRVLVERVEGFATEEQWRRAYREIVDFERTLADEGMIMVKFWLELSDEEQLRRFEARQRDPLKTWKLTSEDWRNREKRHQYEAAVAEMLDRTDHDDAPWVLVEAEDKRYARVKVVESVVAAIESGTAARGFPVPPPETDAAAQHAGEHHDGEHHAASHHEALPHAGAHHTGGLTSPAAASVSACSNATVAALGLRRALTAADRCQLSRSSSTATTWTPGYPRGTAETGIKVVARPARTSLSIRS
jgi:AMP-polyphosphate phosphotransferase